MRLARNETELYQIAVFISHEIARSTFSRVPPFLLLLFLLPSISGRGNGRGRIKIRLHSGWRRKEKRKKLSENYPPRVTLARCRLEIYATRRLILSIESFENRPVKSRSLRASFLPTATREGDFSRVSRRVESLRRQNDPMSSGRQTADAFARFKSPDRSISPAMHYSPECFISPFLNRLSAPTWRDAKPFHPAYYRSPLSQVRITCPDILLFEQKGQRPSSYSVDTLRDEKV